MQIYGLHSVKASIIHNSKNIEKIVLQKTNSHAEIMSLAHAKNIQIVVDKTSFEKLSANHQGVLAIMKSDGKTYNIDYVYKIIKTKQALILVLDQITDPHNFGACIRSAYCAGVDCIITTKDNSAPISDVTKKVASGASELLPIVLVSNLARTIDDLKELGVWFYGADGFATDSIYDHVYNGHTAIIMGSEGKGLRRLTKEKCDFLVKIPMQKTDVSSLNVSVATGIIMFEVVRQQKMATLVRGQYAKISE